MAVLCKCRCTASLTALRCACALPHHRPVPWFTSLRTVALPHMPIYMPSHLLSAHLVCPQRSYLPDNPHDPVSASHLPAASGGSRKITDRLVSLTVSPDGDPSGHDVGGNQGMPQLSRSDVEALATMHEEVSILFTDIKVRVAAGAWGWPRCTKRFYGHFIHGYQVCVCARARVSGGCVACVPAVWGCSELLLHCCVLLLLHGLNLACLRRSNAARAPGLCRASRPCASSCTRPRSCCSSTTSTPSLTSCWRST